MAVSSKSRKIGPKVGDAHVKIAASAEGSIKAMDAVFGATAARKLSAAFNKNYKIRLPLDSTKAQFSKMTDTIGKDFKGTFEKVEDYSESSQKQINEDIKKHTKKSTSNSERAWKATWATIGASAALSLKSVSRSMKTVTGSLRVFKKAGQKAGNSFGKAFNNQVRDRLKGLGRYIRNFLVTAAVFVGIRQSTQAFKDAINAASDFEQNIGAVGEVFKGQEKQINAWASSLGKGFGIAKNEAMDSLKDFGIFAQAAGKSGDESLKFSQKLVELSADLGAFYNTDSAEGLEAISAAMRGQYEPMRKYGVLLSENAVKAEAFNMGIGDGKRTLTQQERILAVNKVILEQTKVAQGQSKREAETFFGVLQRVTSQWQNTLIEIGNVFQPIATSVMSLLSDSIIPVIEEAAIHFKDLFAETEGLDKTLDSIGTWFEKAFSIENIQQFIDFLGQVSILLENMWLSVKPYVVAIKDFGGAVIDIYGAFQAPEIGESDGMASFREAFQDIFSVENAQGFVNFLSSIQKSFEIIFSMLDPYITILVDFGRTLVDIFSQADFTPLAAIMETIFDAVNSLQEPITSLLNSIGEVVQPLIDMFVSDLMPVISEVLVMIIDILSEMAGPLGETFKTLIGFIAELLPPVTEIIGKVLAVATEVIMILLPIVDKVIEILSPFIDTIADVILSLLENIAPAMERLMPSIFKFLDALMPLIETIFIIIEALAEPLGMIMDVIGELAIDILEPIIDLISEVAFMLKDLIITLLPLLKPIMEFVSSIVEALKPFLDIIIEIATVGLRYLIDALMMLVETGVLEDIVELLSAVFLLSAEGFKGIADLIGSAAESFDLFGDGVQGWFDSIGQGYENLVGWISDVMDWISETWNSITELFKGVGDWFVDIGKNIANFFIEIRNMFISVLNNIIDGINSIKFRIPDDTPVIGGKGFDGFNLQRFEEIPKLATGGNVMGETLAILGEKKPETVTDLGLTNRMIYNTNSLIEQVKRSGLDEDRQIQAIFQIENMYAEEEALNKLLKGAGKKIKKGIYERERKETI